MRRLIHPASLLAALGLIGCAGPAVPTYGIDLGDVFPERAEWYWKYNNDDFAEVSYWVNLGNTAPQGEDWTTFRLWVAPEQVIIDDIADGEPSEWDVQFYWAGRADGWYLQGWQANPDGPSAALGTEYLGGDGVPFAMGDVTTGKQWTASVNEREWTITAVEVVEDLEFNGQVLRDVWRLDVVTDTGDTPLEGSWWIAGGPGFVQWDLAPFAGPSDPTVPWQHVHNDTYDNVLGVNP